MYLSTYTGYSSYSQLVAYIAPTLTLLDKFLHIIPTMYVSIVHFYPSLLNSNRIMQSGSGKKKKEKRMKSEVI